MSLNRIRIPHNRPRRRPSRPKTVAIEASCRQSNAFRSQSRPRWRSNAHRPETYSSPRSTVVTGTPQSDENLPEQVSELLGNSSKRHDGVWMGVFQQLGGILFQQSVPEAPVNCPDTVRHEREHAFLSLLRPPIPPLRPLLIPAVAHS